MDLAMEGITTITSTFIDPVCGMEVEAGKARLVAIYQGIVTGSATRPAVNLLRRILRSTWRASPPSEKVGLEVIWSG